MLNSIVGLLDAGVAASTNSYESIQTVTVGAGGQSTISFTSIPGTYKHLQIRALVRESRSTYGISEFDMKLNSDSGSNYSHHGLWGDGGSVSASGNASAGSIRVGNGTSGTNTGTAYGATIIGLLDYADTSKYKTARILSGVDVNGTVGGIGGRLGLFSGSWQSTSAINRIDFTPSSPATDFNQYSSFALYGIKG